MNSKNIVFFSTTKPPINAGAERNAYNFAIFLSKKGYNVSFVSFFKYSKNKFQQDHILNIINIYFNTKNILLKFFTLCKVLIIYTKQIYKNRIIIIYGGHLFGNKFIILIGRLFNRIVIFRSTMYGIDDMHSIINRKKIKIFTKYIFNKVSFYFSISPIFTKSWEKIFNSRKKVLETSQGVDVSLFYPISQNSKFSLKNKLKIPTGLPILISVGYLIERKGFREIFTALSKIENPFLYCIIGDYNISKHHYNYHLYKEMDNLYQLGNDLLGKKVLFLGPKQNVHEYLQTSDIYILNSTQEGVPNALLEAMACHLPPIVRNIPGLKNFILFDKYNSLIHNSKDELKNNILLLLNNKNMREYLGKNAWKSILNHFTFDNTLQILEKKIFIELRKN